MARSHISSYYSCTSQRCGEGDLEDDASGKRADHILATQHEGQSLTHVEADDVQSVHLQARRLKGLVAARTHREQVVRAQDRVGGVLIIKFKKATL
jgi:hypothetical protein